MGSEFNRLSPCPLPSLSGACSRRFRRVLVVLGVLTAVVCADDTRTISIDCVFCGPGQPYPHHCPHLRNQLPPPPPPPPNPLPNLVSQALQMHGRLRTIQGVSLPDLGSADSIEQLWAALAELFDGVQQETDRCRREVADFERGVDSAQRESDRLVTRAAELGAQIEQLKQQITANEAAYRQEQQDMTATRQELDRLRQGQADLHEAIRQMRNQVFPRLQEALRRGWIRPPSSYRDVPAPLPVVTTSTYGAGLSSGPGPALAGDVASAKVGPAYAGDVASALPAGPDRRGAGGPITETSVQRQLAELEVAGDRLREAAAQRAQAYRTLQSANVNRDLRAMDVHLLQYQHGKSVATLATGKRELDRLQLKAAQLAARLDEERQKVIPVWIEWGVFRVLAKEIEEVTTEATGRGVSQILANRYRRIAATAAQLGSDTLGVLQRFPQAMADRGESLDDLQRDLDEAKLKFGLNFISAYTGIPSWVLPYLKKEN